MKTRIVIFALIGIILFTIPLYPASFNGKKILKGMWKGIETEYVEGEILFKMKPKVEENKVKLLLEKNKARLVEGPDKLGIGKLELPSSIDIFAVIENLNSSDLIEFAEPNMIDKAM